MLMLSGRAHIVDPVLRSRAAATTGCRQTPLPSGQACPRRRGHGTHFLLGNVFWLRGEFEKVVTQLGYLLGALRDVGDGCSFVPE